MCATVPQQNSNSAKNRSAPISFSNPFPCGWLALLFPSCVRFSYPSSSLFCLRFPLPSEIEKNNKILYRFISFSFFFVTLLISDYGAASWPRLSRSKKIGLSHFSFSHSGIQHRSEKNAFGAPTNYHYCFLLYYVYLLAHQTTTATYYVLLLVTLCQPTHLLLHLVASCGMVVVDGRCK